MNPYDFYITPDEYERAAQIGVDAENLNRRVRLLGWEKERAITTPLRQITNRRQWSKVARENGIGYYTFMNRVNNLGWDEQKAATEPLQDRGCAAAYATEQVRKIPSEIIRLAEKNRIAYHTLRARLKKGWHPMRAATQPPLTLQEIGRIGAHNKRAMYGDVGRVYLNSGKKFTFSRQIMTPDQYPEAKGT